MREIVPYRNQWPRPLRGGTAGRDRCSASRLQGMRRADLHRYIIPVATCRRKRCRARPSSESFQQAAYSRSVVEECMEFIADAPLVIHTHRRLSFIMPSLTAQAGPFRAIAGGIRLLARQNQGVSNRGDLCSRYAIEITAAQARCDARRRAIAEVYTTWIGRGSRTEAWSRNPIRSATVWRTQSRQREVRCTPESRDDREAHRAFVAPLGDKPIWKIFGAA